jgi:hypothetical protein
MYPNKFQFLSPLIINIIFNLEEINEVHFDKEFINH